MAVLILTKEVNIHHSSLTEPERVMRQIMMKQLRLQHGYFR